MINSDMKDILQKKYGFLRLFLWTLREGFGRCPFHFLVFLLIDITNCLLVFSMTYFMTEFFRVVEENDSYSGQVVLALGVLCAVIILQHATNGIGHSVIPALKLKLDREALVKPERKVRNVPAEWFEQREFLDFLEKAYKGTGCWFRCSVFCLSMGRTAF